MASMMQSMSQSGAGSGTGGAAPYLQVAGSLLSAFGQQQSGDAAVETGQRKLQAARFEATQMRQNAGQAVATSQRTAEDIDRQAEYVASRALAVAAASGAGASDPTIINMIARTAGEAAYRRSAALYQGQEKSRTLNMQADATIYSGESAAADAKRVGSASNIGALSTLAKTGASLFSKYGGDGPNSATGPASGTIDNTVF